jgi:hypothetical protein
MAFQHVTGCLQSGGPFIVDYRLRRIPDMDASGHGMTNQRHLPKFDCGE